MNTPPAPSSNEAQPRVESAILKPAAPSRMASLLDFLGWLGLGIGVLLSLLDYQDMVPPSLLPDGWGARLTAIGGVLLCLRQTIQKLGDLLDNGKADDSFQFVKKTVKTVTIFLTGSGIVLYGAHVLRGALALLCCFCLICCGTPRDMSDGKLAAAKIGVRAAQTAFAGAAVLLMGYVADGKPAWQQAMASKGLESAAKELEEAEERLRAEEERRAAALLPVSAKTALDVTPAK